MTFGWNQLITLEIYSPQWHNEYKENLPVPSLSPVMPSFSDTWGCPPMVFWIVWGTIHKRNLWTAGILHAGLCAALSQTESCPCCLDVATVSELVLLLWIWNNSAFWEHQYALPFAYDDVPYPLSSIHIYRSPHPQLLKRVYFPGLEELLICTDMEKQLPITPGY